jgi:hypothetical protein
MSAPYILRRDGHDYQAPDLETLRAWAQAGRVLPADLVYSPVYQSWYRASDLRGLRDVLPNRDAGPPPVVAPQAVSQCFWLRKGEQNYAADSLEVILQWASEGVIDPDDFIFHPAYGKWFQAGDSPQLTNRFPPHIKHQPPFLPASADPMASAEARPSGEIPVVAPRAAVAPVPTPAPIPAAAAPQAARPASLESADSMAKTVMDMQAIRVDMLRPAAAAPKPAEPKTPEPKAAEPAPVPVQSESDAAFATLATFDDIPEQPGRSGAAAPVPQQPQPARPANTWQTPAGGLFGNQRTSSANTSPVGAASAKPAASDADNPEFRSLAGNRSGQAPGAAVIRKSGAQAVVDAATIREFERRQAERAAASRATSEPLPVSRVAQPISGPSQSVEQAPEQPSIAGGRKVTDSLGGPVGRPATLAQDPRPEAPTPSPEAVPEPTTQTRPQTAPLASGQDAPREATPAQIVSPRPAPVSASPVAVAPVAAPVSVPATPEASPSSGPGLRPHTEAASPRPAPAPIAPTVTPVARPMTGAQPVVRPAMVPRTETFSFPDPTPVAAPVVPAATSTALSTTPERPAAPAPAPVAVRPINPAGQSGPGAGAKTIPKPPPIPAAALGGVRPTPPPLPPAVLEAALAAPAQPALEPTPAAAAQPAVEPDPVVVPVPAAEVSAPFGDAEVKFTDRLGLMKLFYDVAKVFVYTRDLRPGELLESSCTLGQGGEDFLGTAKRAIYFRLAGAIETHLHGTVTAARPQMSVEELPGYDLMHQRAEQLLACMRRAEPVIGSKPPDRFIVGNTGRPKMSPEEESLIVEIDALLKRLISTRAKVAAGRAA